MTIKILFLLVLLGCGEGTNSGAIKYYLQRAATATTSNELRLEVQGPLRPKFSFTGKGFTAEVPFDTMLDLRESTLLTADQFGEVFLDITLYQENDRPYLSDRLSWKSSPEVPPEPEPTFSEDASADAYVYLILPTTRGKNVQEVWVEGDVEPAAGQYYPIPGDDQVLLRLSEGDGIKSIRIKYRNIFGTDGAFIETSIARKSQPPINCTATPVATKTATGAIRMRVAADNDGPLYFRVEGDVETLKEYRSFDEVTDEYTGLAGNEGIKHLTVKIRDAAGNFCEDIPLAITYDRSYVPGSIAYLGDLIWTDDPTVVIIPKFDFLPGDNVTMSISGTVAASAETFQWIPFQDSLPVTLTPTNGTRHVIIQFRKDATLMAEVTSPIFLKPYVLINGAGAVVDVIPSNIVGATSLTILGCAESYVRVAYASSFVCTRAAAAATVTYYLKDGSSVTRSQVF